MQSNRLALGIVLGGLVGGCAPVKPPAYVNLDQVLAARPQFVRERFEAPPPQPGFRASSVWPALPARAYGAEQVRARLEQARELVAQNRVKALSNLSRQLFESYVAEFERVKVERTTALETAIREAIDGSQDELSALLHAYADDRMRPLTRLAYHVGFPFPPESNLIPPQTGRPLAQKRYDEAKSLYSTLERLEQEYERKVEALMLELFQRIARQRQEMGVEFAEAVTAYQERARQEAQIAIEAINNQIDLSLIEQDSLRLAALPASTATVAAPPPKLERAAGGPAPPLVDPKEAALAEISVWAATRGYRLVPSRLEGPDRTDEFLQWQMNERAGRSASSPSN